MDSLKTFYMEFYQLLLYEENFELVEESDDVLEAGTLASTAISWTSFTGTLPAPPHCHWIAMDSWHLRI